MLDFLAIGVHELASISERRIERLVNPALSGLPAFLVQNGGLHSGFMIAHCTAAALLSENKVSSCCYWVHLIFKRRCVIRRQWIPFQRLLLKKIMYRWEAGVHARRCK